MTRRVLAALATTGVLCAACGVGTQPSAQVIARDSVPYGLLVPAATTPASTVPAAAVVTLFFQGPDGLVPVARRVALPVSATKALSQLTEGPVATEGGGGLQSPVSTVSPITLKRVDQGIAYVSVPTSFTSLGGQDQIVAAAQLVCTLTAVHGVSSVELLVGGQPAEVPIAGGSLQAGPLDCGEYSSMLAA